MSHQEDDLRIPLQVGSELRIKNSGEVVVSNPELELAAEQLAADAVLSYRFDEANHEHVLRLIDPVADHRHLAGHREND